MTDLIGANGLTERGWQTLLVVLAVWLVCYLLACWVWPWARCRGEWLPWPRKCDVGRVYQNERKKAWRDCRRCRGTGKRRRFGRILWARFVKAKRKAEK